MPVSLSRRLAMVVTLTVALLGAPAWAAVDRSRPAADPDWVKSTVAAEAERQGVPGDLALAVAHVESTFRSNALSNKGARGVMQIMPTTAMEWYGVGADELWDAATNIHVGVRHLSDLHQQFGSWDLALVGYYAGPGVAQRGLEQASADVRGYVAKVNAARGQFLDQAPAAETTVAALAEPIEVETLPPPPAATRMAALDEPLDIEALGAAAPARPRPVQAWQPARTRTTDPALLAAPARGGIQDPARVRGIWQRLGQW